MENEIWADIENWQDYEVSNFGRVVKYDVLQSKEVKHIWSPTNNEFMVALVRDNKKTLFKVSRLVITAFLGRQKGKIVYKDGDSKNHTLNNLEYAK